jgi:hypothetical protein
MTNRISAPVWSVLHPLRFLQFPWRFLETATFFLCLAAGSLATIEVAAWARTALVGGLVALIVVANFRTFRPTRYLHVTEAQLLTGRTWDAEVMHSIVDYLPKAASRTPHAPAAARVSVVTGAATIRDLRIESDRDEVDVSSRHGATIRLSTIWFPGWAVSVDGRRAGVTHDNEFGLITVAVPPGNATVVAAFHDTPVRQIGTILTLAGLAAVALVGVVRRRPFTAP